MAVSWRVRRQRFIIVIVTAAIVFFVGWAGIKTFYHPPSCTDGRQNQGETGIDCGGPCAHLCASEGLKPVEHWARAFAVANGRYNAVAYVENPNITSGAMNVPYEFKFYDSSSILVAERTGVANIPPHASVPIFEANIDTGARSPARVEFAFLAAPEWIRSSVAVPELQILEAAPQDIQTSPIASGTIINKSKSSLRAFSVVAIVYDSSGNAQEASQTVIDSLGPEGSVPVTFSWPYAFSFTPARIEMLPIIYPGVNY